MTIREATVEDADAICQMAQAFQRETRYRAHVVLDEERLSMTVLSLIQSHQALLLIVEDVTVPVGMMAAALYAHPMSGECVAHELCWWIDPVARGGRTALRLLRRAEQWAQARGAQVFQMVAPEARIGAFYERLGYAAVEQLYQRRLP